VIHISNLIFYSIFTIFIATIMTVMVWSISGLFLSANASLTVRANRKTLLQLTYPTSVCFGMVTCSGIDRGQYLLQGDILLVGSILMFIISIFKFGLLFRRVTVGVGAIWSVVCFFWAIILPIEIDKIFIVF
jgi:hypothetical protein